MFIITVLLFLSIFVIFKFTDKILASVAQRDRLSMYICECKDLRHLIHQQFVCQISLPQYLWIYNFHFNVYTGWVCVDVRWSVSSGDQYYYYYFVHQMTKYSRWTTNYQLTIGCDIWLSLIRLIFISKSRLNNKILLILWQEKEQLHPIFRNISI